MSEEKKIDCSCTDEIVCPYCGYVFSDSWEFGATGDPECYECRKIFSFTTEVDVHYYSERDCALNQIEHVWSLEKELKHRNMDQCANCDKKRFVEKSQKEKTNIESIEERNERKLWEEAAARKPRGTMGA